MMDIKVTTMLKRSAPYLRYRVPDDQFKRHVDHVGIILSSIQLDLMAPTSSEHSDLDPDRRDG